MGGTWKKNVSFYEAEHFVLFFRNASFCGLYVMVVATTKYNVDVKIGLQPEIRVSGAFNKVLNRVNLSLPVGISYEYRHVAIDFRYHIGLTHVYKDQDQYDLSHGKTVMLTLGYGFDL